MVRSMGNPPWLRDEVILLVDLYLRIGPAGEQHPEVVALSQLLSKLPLHEERKFSSTFRNPTGVHMKLQNIRNLDNSQVGRGLSAASKLDREIWFEFHQKADKLNKLAEAIRLGASLAIAETPVDGETEAEEGQILMRIHRSYERKNSLVAKRKSERRKETGGLLTCEVCDFDFVSKYGTRGEDFAECHHKVPIAEFGVRTTKLQDLAILCANCHRMIHVKKPMLTVEQLSQIVRGAF